MFIWVPKHMLSAITRLPGKKIQEAQPKQTANGEAGFILPLGGILRLRCSWFSLFGVIFNDACRLDMYPCLVRFFFLSATCIRLFRSLVGDSCLRHVAFQGSLNMRHQIQLLFRSSWETAT